MERLKLLGMSAVLTLLIWAGADSMVNQIASLRATFEVVPLDDSSMLVELDPSAKSLWYQLRVSGPRRIIEELREREPLQVRLRIGDHATGTFILTLDPEIIKSALIESRNELRKLTVLGAEPKNLPILVDHLVTGEVQITLDSPTLPYDDAPQLKRTFISVRMRESRYEELARNGQHLRIDISPDVERLLKTKPAGQSATITVSLEGRSFGPDAVLTPPWVEVMATVKAQHSTAEIPTVTIKPVISFANLGNPYHAVARDGTRLTLVTKTIRVTGPTAEVNKLLRGETRGYGFISLKEADFQELGVFKVWVPEFYLPPQIVLDQEPAPIEFKLVVAQSATEPASEGGR